MEVGDAREVDRRSTRMEKVINERGLHFLVFQSPIIVWEVISDASKTVISILSKLNIYNMLFIYHYDWMYKYHNYISSNKCTSVCAIFRLIRLILTKIYSIVHSFDWNKILLWYLLKTHNHIVESEPFQHLHHSLDVWHKTKKLVSTLLDLAKRASYKDLMPWIRPIVNHYWWCCSSAKGKTDKLLKRWMGILFHINNKHIWPGGRWFKFKMKTLHIIFYFRFNLGGMIFSIQLLSSEWNFIWGDLHQYSCWHIFLIKFL